ncbi:MAG TPA: sugar kinase [Lachnospiraceae bacterium]|uniref:NAD(+)/NADH kinase n=1 Tax=Anaerosporobacter sp. TaxID=1872529 RepID=UPI000ECE9E17|nr:NAD(+)/NADH kinase [Anaerosporobacter sp.]HAB62028.1 sugar kinase [Lachnospiraceae bacterium]
MNNFCIITNIDKDCDYKTTKLIQEYLISKGKRCFISSEPSTVGTSDDKIDVSWITDDTDCVIVLGGDGTIIRAATDLYTKEIPLLGINLGTLGFLAEIEKQDIIPAIDSLLEEDIQIQKRMMLYGNVSRNNQTMYEDYALNDIVISRSGFSRIICVSVYVNDILVDTYHGDGVIIATPTGSTGYNLSAGGPVAAPSSNVMMITPICPHTMSQRSVLVSSDDEITILIDKSKKTQKEEAIATFDGRMGMELEAGDEIRIKRAEKVTKLIKINQKSFYEILRSKLR